MDIEQIQEISTSLLKCVETDNVVGARCLLAGIYEQDRKLIVAKRDNCNAPLFIAVIRGNVDMVKFLVEECQADTGELGRYEKISLKYNHLVTPLSGAVASYKPEVVKLLIDLGADINAVSETGRTPVLEACFRNVEVAKCLIKHGADVNIPDNDGKTCLMSAVKWRQELCHILIDKGAKVNAQDMSGDSALHWATNAFQNINADIENTVQLLIDHGSNPYIKNNYDDDVFRKASLEGQESILKKLLLNFELPVSRKIESYELLGAFHASRSPVNIEKALHYWREAVEMRRMNSHLDVSCLQPNPVYLFAREVKTVEELEALFQTPEHSYMHALLLRERILGPTHIRVQSGLLFRGGMYKEDGNYRRCIDLWRYAYKLQTARVVQFTTRSSHRYYDSALYHLCSVFCESYRKMNNNFRIEFEEVLDVLQIAISYIDDATGVILLQEFQKDEYEQLIFTKLILHLIKFIAHLDKNENQLLSFKKILHRLVRKQSKIHNGRTLLHLSVLPSTSKINERFFSQFPSSDVVELLLECGANVNAVDDQRNTALHVCSKAIQNLEINQDCLKMIVLLLLKNDAHADMVNDLGDRAATSLIFSLMEMNIQDLVSLKCLAACAVMKYAISYVGHIPDSLESFVQMHGICAWNCNLPA